MFPGLLLDNFQRGLPIRVRRNRAQDFDRPILRARGRPIEAGPVRNADGIPMGVCFVDGRRGFYVGQPVRSPPRSRFVDVMEDGKAARPGIMRGRRDQSIGYEDLAASLDFYDEDFSVASPQNRPETRQTGPQSQKPGSKSQQTSDVHEQLGNTARHQSTAKQEWRLGSAVQGLSFGKAIKSLHEVLGKADHFYTDFQQNFDNEVQNVSYANKEMKKMMWSMKMAAPSQEVGQDDKPAEKWQTLFAEQRSGLYIAMKAFLNVSLSQGDNKSTKATTLAAWNRLQEKVETASNQIMELLKLATKDHEHCKALLSEVQLLKDLVNPDKPENKGLFEAGDGGVSGGKENKGGSNDGEGQAEEQQAESWEQTQDN